MEEIVLPLPIDDIEMNDGRRQVDPAAVKKLAESIDKIGLRHPITVRRKGESYVLVAGRHRIEAFKALDREHIPSCIVSMTNAEARMWEIAENLHRCDLSKLEKAEQIEEWRRLSLEEGAKKFSPLGGHQPHDKGIAKTAEKLGVTEHEVRVAERLSTLTPEAKDAAEEAGIDDNQSKLLAVAKESPEHQVAKVIELATAKPGKLAAEPLNDFETKEKWMSTGMAWWNKGSKEWREEFLSRVDQPVMDHRYGR